jgi:hypothetical protein
MKMTLSVLATASLLPAVAAPARAADLAKLDRSIVKEPAYVSSPRYCLLVFGPEAAKRVWLVIDGDFLYVDRNGNGDLTEPGERVRFGSFSESGVPGTEVYREATCENVAEGKLKHERLTVRQWRLKKEFVPANFGAEALKALAARDGERFVYYISLSVEVRPRPGDPIRIAGRIKQEVWADDTGYLQFAASPKEAPVIHFRGPLRMGLYEPQCLILGTKPCDLKALVGTPGVGKGTFASIGFDGLIDPESKPAADIEFPAASRSGGTAVTARYTLPHRC